MIVKLSDVLAVVISISLAGFMGMYTVRAIRASLSISDPQPPKYVPLMTALGNVIRKSGSGFAFTMVMLWLLPSEGAMQKEPLFNLLYANDTQWRIYIMLTVFGLSLIASAAGLLLDEVGNRIKRLIQSFADKHVPPKAVTT